MEARGEAGARDEMFSRWSHPCSALAVDVTGRGGLEEGEGSVGLGRCKLGPPFSVDWACHRQLLLVMSSHHLSLYWAVTFRGIHIPHLTHPTSA